MKHFLLEYKLFVENPKKNQIAYSYDKLPMCALTSFPYPFSSLLHTWRTTRMEARDPITRRGNIVYAQRRGGRVVVVMVREGGVAGGG